jgi:chemotaxis protein CheZ
MTENALERLTTRLREISNREPRPDPGIIDDVVAAVLGTMGGRLSTVEAGLLKEVGELGRIIAKAKHEIAEISVDAITESHIPTATDELDAIVAHTAQATDSILEACEALDHLAGVVTKEHADILSNATTTIYEACSFQDITGQRITKVVKALKVIEAKVVQISASVDVIARQRQEKPDSKTGPITAEDLLNGPGLPHLAMDQSDIDKLLADFD